MNGDLILTPQRQTQARAKTQCHAGACERLPNLSSLLLCRPFRMTCFSSSVNLFRTPWRRPGPGARVLLGEGRRIPFSCRFFNGSEYQPASATNSSTLLDAFICVHSGCVASSREVDLMGTAFCARRRTPQWRRSRRRAERPPRRAALRISPAHPSRGFMICRPKVPFTAAGRPSRKSPRKSCWPTSGGPTPRTKRRSKRISRARISRSLGHALARHLDAVLGGLPGRLSLVANRPGDLLLEPSRAPVFQRRLRSAPALGPAAAAAAPACAVPRRPRRTGPPRRPAEARLLRRWPRPRERRARPSLAIAVWPARSGSAPSRFGPRQDQLPARDRGES